MRTTKNIALLFLFLGATLGACKKNTTEDVAPKLTKPTIQNVEVGLSNSEIGTIGKDFHFECDVIAGDRIDNVQIKIQPKAGETYAKDWKFEVTWEYDAVKNTNVHKHFAIPADAAEGKYDFIIIVNDHNGTKLEDKRTVTLYTEANLPVNPSVSVFNVFKNAARFYRNGQFTTAGAKFAKNDVIQSQVTISNVKGSGKMYLLLINKKHGHRPESIDKIDLSKAIVYDVYEHSNWTKTDFFSNSVFDTATFTVVREYPAMTIGAALDNNVPKAAISGAKAWESGTYYYGVVYKNTTYNMGYFQYIEIPIEL